MKHEKKRSKSRMVSYVYEGSFDKPTMEATIQKGVDTGVVERFDTDAGRRVWFEGFPGEGMRAVRDAVEALLKAGGSWKSVRLPS